MGEIGEERRQLRRGEHALVDERPRRQRREIDERLAAGIEEFVFDALAGDEHATVELDARQPIAGIADEQLAEFGHGAHRGLADVGGGGIGRNVAPAEHRQALGVDDLADHGHSGFGCGGILRQERETGRVPALGREFELHHGPEEPVGRLHEDAGAVAGVGLRAGGAAVFEVAQRADRQLDEPAAAGAVHLRDEGHAARVVFIGWVVQALPGRRDCARHRFSPGGSVEGHARDAVGPGRVASA